MKRKRDIDELCNVFADLNCSKKKRESAKISTNKQRKQLHHDVFNIGKLALNKRFYSKEDVEEIIEQRETILFAKFKDFVKRNIQDGDNACELPVPTWIL